MSEDIKRVRDAHRWLIRPALVAAIGLTLFGNLAQAQPSVGGWLSHGWAPSLYLILVEILVRRAVGGHWLWPVVVGFIVLALTAGIVSFSSLTRAAERWGWAPGEAWMFPVIVDLTAVLLTMASVGAGVRIRELKAAEQSEPVPNAPNVRKAKPNKRGERSEDQPNKPNRPEPHVRQPAEQAEQAPERPNGRPAENKWTEKILKEFGHLDPNDWPNMSNMAQQFVCSKSTLSNPYKRAEQLARELSNSQVGTSRTSLDEG